MADIGTATIRILADSKAFDDTLAKLGQRTAGAFERSTRGLVDRANGIGRQFGERLGESATRWLRRGLVAGAAGIAAVVGGTLVKGFRRFTTIEDATASLTLQLQDAEKAAGLLGAVLKVVEGTPFALDQFVDAARNLVAASIPLEKVPGILEAVADAAAAAGGSAEDVDNVVNAIGRLATGAELTLGPIRDLEELGVPALRILANQAGKSTQEMAKDISAGTVDSKKAIDDLVEGLIEGTNGINGATVAFGGAAKNVGNTVSGAFANMSIAVDRAGAKILDVFAKSGEEGRGLVDILNSVRETIDIVGDRAVIVARRIVGSEGWAQVLTFFEELPGRVKAVGLVQAILEGIRKGMEKVPPGLVGEVIALVIIRGVEGISEFLPQIVAAVVREAPGIIGAIAQGLLAAAQENPLDFALFIGALGLPGLGPALVGFFSRLPFGFIVAPLLTGIRSALVAGASALGLQSFFSILAGKLSLGIVLLAGPISAALVGVLTVLAGIALGVLINQFIEKFFPEINRSLEQGGAAIFDFFVDEVFPFFTDTVPNFFTSTIPGIVDTVVGYFGELGGDAYEAIAESFAAVIDFFRGLPDRIFEAIGNLFERFKQAGRDIMDGIKEGASDVLNDSSWGKFWQDAGGDAYDFFTGQGGIDSGSPSRKFMEAGRSMVEGIVAGVEQVAPKIDRALASLVPPSTEMKAPLVDTRFPGASNPATRAAQIIHNWQITEVASGRETAEQVINRLAAV